MTVIILESVIERQVCGYKKTEAMPTNACIYFYTCEKCKTWLKPKEGDCCVFRLYGSFLCPPIQEGNNKNCYS